MSFLRGNELASLVLHTSTEMTSTMEWEVVDPFFRRGRERNGKERVDRDAVSKKERRERKRERERKWLSHILTFTQSTYLIERTIRGKASKKERKKEETVTMWRKEGKKNKINMVIISNPKRFIFTEDSSLGGKWCVPGPAPWERGAHAWRAFPWTPTSSAPPPPPSSLLRGHAISAFWLKKYKV